MRDIGHGLLSKMMNSVEELIEETNNEESKRKLNELTKDIICIKERMIDDRNYMRVQDDLTNYLIEKNQKLEKEIEELKEAK